MMNQSLRTRFRVLMALWIGLALVVSPAATLAAPATSTHAQTAYADPDGRFSMTLPESFTEEVAIDYEMMGDNPLDKLASSAGIAFAEVDSPNGAQALFLLLDEPIEDQIDFAAFLAAFQVAAGGELLPLVDLAFVDAESLIAEGSASNDERHLRIQIRAQGDVAAIVSSSVERSRYRGLRGAIDAAFDSFTWDPAVVRTSLGGADEPLPPEPDADESAAEDVEESSSSLRRTSPSDGEDATADTQGAATEEERYFDEGEVFSLVMPSGLEPEDISDDVDIVYGFGYWAEDDVENPSVVVGFTPSAYAGDLRTDEFDMWEIDDTEWDIVVDTFLIDDLSDMNVRTDLRNATHRTAFLVLEDEAGDDGAQAELWVWMEESEGVVAVIGIFGELNDPDNTELFHEAMTSFEWSPSNAKSELSILADLYDPNFWPLAVNDPFGLVEMVTPDAFPFQAAFYGGDGVEYRFGQDSPFGSMYLSVVDLNDGPMSADDWALYVASEGELLLTVLQEQSTDGTASILSSELDALDVGADNTALIHADGDDYQVVEVLQDMDGVVSISLYFLEDFYWELFQDDIMFAVNEGISFDAVQVREMIAQQGELGVTTQLIHTVNPMAEEGEPDEPVFNFYPDEAFELVAKFYQPDLTENVEVIIYDNVLPGYPIAQYGLWTGEEEQYSTNKSTFQDESGTEVRFNYQPDFPLNVGGYIAYVYYDEVLVAASGLTVWNDEAVEPELSNFGVTYGDFYNGEVPLTTTAINQSDVVALRGTGNLPAGSQLRLLWYNQDGLLINDDVATIRLESNFQAIYDWFYFEPIIAWQPGYYHYVLTLDGEELDAGTLLVIADAAEVALTDDAGAYIAQMPLSTNLEIAPVVEGVDLAILPDGLDLAKEIVSGVDAWLRMQGWQPTLPALGSPVYWDYRRWVKDGYQIVLEPGTDDRNNQLWLSYAPVSDSAFGPAPSGEALDTLNLETLDEVAQLKLEGLSAVDAVISPDGNWMAVTTSDGALFIFDAHRLMDIIFYRPNVYYSDPVFSPDSQDLAVTLQLQSRSEIQVFSNFGVMWLATTRLNGHVGSVTDIVYQPDGWLASGDTYGELRYWDVSGESGPIMTFTDKPVLGLAPAPEEAPGLLIAMDGGYVDYRLDSGEWAWTDAEVQSESPYITAWAQLDEDGVGDFVVYGDGQAEWYIYDLEPPELIAALPEANEEFVATGAAFTPNGELLVIGGDTTLVYDRFFGDLLDEWELTDGGDVLRVESLSVSPDGQYIVVVSDDGKVRLWAVAQ